ncbi:hypothetical protein DYB32_006119 [Aphanomyces invadans]|uniref:PH domain-containing protein n=1 Tax=Aphanomyces invadans TaxID=157072 RepID=A0A3R6VJX8_9STRA|nr:hypothetical protein DYB32_006119 [Aphanomyces invadans]
MRIYKVNDKLMWQSEYSDVLDAIRKAVRPVVVVFVDVDGPQCRDEFNEDDDNNEMDEDEWSPEAQQALYRRHVHLIDQIDMEDAVQDTAQLHWDLHAHHLAQEAALVHAKIHKMHMELAAQAEETAAWHQKITDLHDDQRRYRSIIDDLDSQAAGTAENPLLVRAKRLEERSQKLHDRTKKLKSDHKKLKVRQEALTKERHELDALVDALPEDDVSESRKLAAALFDVDVTLPLHEQLALFQRQLKEVDKEYQQEDRRRKLVQREVQYMRKHIKSLSKAEKKLKKTTKVKSSEIDTRKSNLREKLKLINDQLATAAEAGDNELAAKLTKRRKHLTKELRALQEDDSASAKNAPTASKKQAKRAKKTAPAKAVSTGSTGNDVAIGAMRPRAAPSPTARQPSVKLDFFLEGMLDKHPTISNETDVFTIGWKNFKKAYPRFCIITARGTLAYYRQQGDAEARGELNLADRSMEIQVYERPVWRMDSSQPPHVCVARNGCVFTLCTNTESTKFEARSSGECRKWVDAIKAANYHFVTACSRRQLTK